MDTRDLKRIMEENCEQLSKLLEDCQDNMTGIGLLSKVMGPVLEEYRQLQEQTFHCTDCAPVPESDTDQVTVS